jgi:hypothetical protein
MPGKVISSPPATIHHIPVTAAPVNHTSTQYTVRSGGEGSDLRQRQFLLPAGILQVVRLHERQPIPVEHEADVDEEHPVAGAAVEEFLLEKFADAADRSGR